MGTAVVSPTAPPTPAVTRRPARAQIKAGVVAVTPMAVGVAPFGLAIGSAAAAADMSTGAALASAPLLFAGAAQLTAVQMLDAGAAPAVIIVSALMINARILLYSTSLAPWFRDESFARRLVLAVPVIDQLHFTCVPRFEQGDLDQRERVAFYGGAAGLLTATWLVTHSGAILVGSNLPDAAGLHMAAPLALTGLLATAMSDRRSSMAALAAGITVMVAAGAPFRSAVLIATIVGIAVGCSARREVSS